ncbi:PREDICTED: EF-hand calcium-binding domain-containing protein 9 [Nipponia nippon]|uniref:EF-hand calcium-binding domain-containing protein 9 n=1 Tax=Nipponia nippon TaxID=128390 RepID=UPI0005108D31|nr:PREDICTED: EF-hand calcium-binding domain-containing protein 9 [Nipponia nippon]
MKLKSGCFLQHLHLDDVYRLLSVRNTAALAEYFQLLDVHQKNYLNNLQFYCFLRYVTSLTKDQIMLLFDSLDGNTRDTRLRASARGCCLQDSERSQRQDVALQVIRHMGGVGKGLREQPWSSAGRQEPSRHSLNPAGDSACSRLAPPQEAPGLRYFLRNHLEKRFIRWHAGPAFQLLDVDGDDMIDFNEFEATRFLFNIQKEELKKIFKDFLIFLEMSPFSELLAGGYLARDLSPLQNSQLNCREFKMFAVFCIDKQQQKEEGDHE